MRIQSNVDPASVNSSVICAFLHNMFRGQQVNKTTFRSLIEPFDLTCAPYPLMFYAIHKYYWRSWQGQFIPLNLNFKCLPVSTI